MLVVVPAYEPDQRLPALVRDLRVAAPALEVLVVDDGSGPVGADALAGAEEAGATVVHHCLNRGKGRALRTGFRWALEHRPGEAVVCVDADGQHRPEDVLRVARCLSRGAEGLVLGTRGLDAHVPWRSRLGNGLTRVLFRAATGHDVRDTQTGLRGLPAALLPWALGVAGDRYEYELEQLLRAEADGVPVTEVPIATVYLEDNASSHFRPMRDGVRIYRQLARFAASGLVAATVDWVLLVLLHALTGSLLVAVVGARVTSAALNFATNRRLVFGRAGSPPGAARRYAVLVAALLVANWALMEALVAGLGLPLLLGKLLTELALVAVSFVAQRRVVFARRGVPLVPASAVEEEDVAGRPALSAR
ncbi:bifunctional glycosyltransferase family 2/GtrA family protein [Phycicoccus endophyticus]|uniref:Bifunctional glycosyltransferase family 2/GtrA family protein n=1 Tax=Phycicoccus endophyticus TaxID=1690220 RepID=A0A7G9R2I6_9MICO|nr:bifunctional glycosyltransferase family 2/GtrA family protein [Phycicoccus endophyticus]NHI20731.1 glycosyltransferase [Phycicoccus endophyticus]QNN49811.1 bifunctional glycosyltransferase family 2/GtrA family protein [Phycicoccus endophyticus]GGL35316.1 glycosyl transferase [Phycicoccus endophyticus]